MEEKSIDIEELLKLFKRKFWIIIVVTVITTSIGVYNASKLQPSYRTSAKVFIGKSDELVQYYSEEEVEYYAKIVSIFQELSTIDGFFDDVLEKKGINKSSIEVASGLSIVSSENAPIFSISYRSSINNEMEETLEAVCDELIAKVKQIMPETVPVVLNKTTVVTIYPDKLKTPTLSAFLGIILGLFIILVIYYMDDRITSISKLDNIVHGFILANLPKYDNKFGNNVRRCVVNKSPNSLSAEAYKSLRTRIKFASKDKRIKTIVITSAIGGEGKSTVSSNLAFTLGQTGAKVLIVDCDLRKDINNNNKLSLYSGYGLTDYIGNKCTFKDIVNKINDSVFSVNSGSRIENPAEILGSSLMDNFLKEVSKEFDYIVIDTTPALLVTDTMLLASKADATIIVTRCKKTKEKLLRQAYEELKKARANVIGTVLNDSDEGINGKYFDKYDIDSSKDIDKVNKHEEIKNSSVNKKRKEKVKNKHSIKVKREKTKRLLNNSEEKTESGLVERLYESRLCKEKQGEEYEYNNVEPNKEVNIKNKENKDNKKKDEKAYEDNSSGNFGRVLNEPF